MTDGDDFKQIIEEARRRLDYEIKRSDTLDKHVARFVELCLGVLSITVAGLLVAARLREDGLDRATVGDSSGTSAIRGPLMKNVTVNGTFKMPGTEFSISPDPVPGFVFFVLGIGLLFLAVVAMTYSFLKGFHGFVPVNPWNLRELRDGDDQMHEIIDYYDSAIRNTQKNRNSRKKVCKYFGYLTILSIYFIAVGIATAIWDGIDPRLSYAVIAVIAAVFGPVLSIKAAKRTYDVEDDPYDSPDALTVDELDRKLANGPDEVSIDGGCYEISTPLSVPRGTTLVPHDNHNRPIFIGSPDLPPMSSLIRLDGDSSGVERIRIHGLGNADTAIEAVASDTEINDVEVDIESGTAIHIHGDNKGDVSNQVMGTTITDNTIHLQKGAESAISIRAGGGVNVRKNEVMGGGIRLQPPGSLRRYCATHSVYWVRANVISKWPVGKWILKRMQPNSRPVPARSGFVPGRSYGVSQDPSLTIDDLPTALNEEVVSPNDAKKVKRILEGANPHSRVCVDS